MKFGIGPDAHVWGKFKRRFWGDYVRRLQMGRGYHARINRLLRTWAQMKIAGEVQLDAYLAKRVGGDKAETAEDGEAGEAG